MTRLVYFEEFQYVNQAIAREKELKDWNRARKLALIEGTNPAWTDLSEGWSRDAVTPVYEGEVGAEGSADPSASLRDDKG
jgi:putative endonuclease